MVINMTKLISTRKSIKNKFGSIEREHKLLSDKETVVGRNSTKLEWHPVHARRHMWSHRCMSTQVQNP